MGNKHAKYGASGSAQWINCPGVMGMKSLCPPETTSDAAKEGTAAHDILELCLTEDMDAYEHIDRSVTVEGKQFIVDEDMADAVQECLDFARACIQSHPGCETMFEQKVDISELVAPDMFGTVDIRIAEPFGKLHIIDYKHGRGVPVEAEGNTQLIYYALGSAAEDDFNFEEVEMTIVQPRCPHSAGPIRSWTVSMDELLSYVDKFKDARKTAEWAEEQIVEAGKPKADLVNAGKWCKFCPAKAICPAQYKQTIEMAQLDFDDGEYTMPEVDFDSLTEEQILQVLEVGDDVKKYVDAVISMAHTMLENGKELPGWKLVKKRANAKFADDDLTVIGKLAALGFSENQTTRMKLQTLTSLRKTCGKEVIEKLTYKPDNGTTIAPESDKREAVIPSAISDFDD